MAKKQFMMPRVLLSGWGGEGSDTGGGSGGTSPDATMCTYKEWLEMYGLDMNEDGTVDEFDFAWWWDDQGFTPEDWAIYNPDIEWPL